MKTRSVAPMRVAKIGYIVLSALICVLGVLMMVMPEQSLSSLVKIFGISMMAFGVIKLVGYFSKDLYRLAFQYDLQFGILVLVLGLIVTVKPNNALNFLCIALGVSILADGLFKMQIALDSKKFGISTWWLIMLPAVCAGMVGLIMVFRPTESLRVMTILLGLSLLTEGLLNLIVALLTVKIIKNQIPDVIDEDSYH